ncbi:MAG: tolQ protein, partial [Myxococcales bacterium]|nr:tolQ protein [Myxococcales bacterium]
MFDLKHIWTEMWWPNKAIMIFIFMMAVASVAVTIERVIALGKSAKISRQFARRAETAIEIWDIDALRSLAAEARLSSLARLFDAIAAKYQFV